MRTIQNRDVVVIGSSLGGIEALQRLVGRLPGDLPAAVLIVQHTSSESPVLLPDILSRQGPLPAVTAENGMEMRHGQLYVAPPDRHLLVDGLGLRLTFGPRENRSRPAIDPLFRSAAVHCRSRVVGVVLTGLLGDGAAGLLAIHECGGAAVVQSPDDAAYPEMPRQALAAVPGAWELPLAEIGALIARLVREDAPEPPPMPDALRVEVSLMERAMPTAADWGSMPSQATDFTCPECNGALRKIDGNVQRYRCRVGHSYTTEDLLAAKGDGVESALWLALQTLQERAQMLESLVDLDQSRGWVHSAGGYARRAVEARAAADELRQLIGSLSA